MLSADAKTCGARRDAAPSDLQYLTDENIAEIGTRCQLLQPRPASRFAVPAGSAMTHIEKMRLQAALEALPGALSRPLVALLLSRMLTTECRQRKRRWRQQSDGRGLMFDKQMHG